MYLLGLRDLGHEVFYVEDTGECIYDPVQNARHRGSRLRHRLHPRRAGAVRPRRPLELRELRRRVSRRLARDGARASAPTPTCSSTCPAAPGSGATSTRAFRARCSSTPIRCSRSSRSPRATPWYVEFFKRLRSPVHVRRQHRHAGVATCRPPASPGTRRGSRSSTELWRRRAAAARRPVHHGHDLAHRELHRRGRQQGPRVREVHRPAVAHAAPVRARRQRAAGAAARSTAGRPWTPWRVSRTPWRLPRLHPGLEGRVRRRQARLRGAPLRLVQRSHRVLPRRRPPGARAGHRLERAPAARRGPARASRRPRRRSTASTASPATTTATRGAPPRSPADCFDAGRVLPRLLEMAGR